MSGWHYGVKENGCTAAEEGGERRCRLQLWASWESSPALNIVGINTLQFPTIWKDLIEWPQHRGIKKKTNKSIPVFCSVINTFTFSENAVWNTWSGINRVGGAKLSMVEIGDGVLTGSLESDDKSTQSGSYFGFCLLVEMSRHLHFWFIVWMWTHPFPPPRSLRSPPERHHRAFVAK